MHSNIPVPRGPEDITPDWMTSALGAESPVTSLSLEPIGKGRGFVGNVVRCHLIYREGSANPATVVIKMPATDAQRRDVFSRFGLYEREVGFYRDLRDDSPIPTPRCHHAAIDDKTGDFVLVLEDMGPAAPGNPLSGMSIAQCREAVDVLSRLHLRWWNDVSLGEREWVVGANAPRMKAVIASQYEGAWLAFESAFGQHLPGPLLKLGASLGTKLPQVLDHLSAPPVTLVHGDFQPANIFYAPAGGIAAIGDWQVIVRARGAMDVAYFMVNGMNPEDRRSFERDLLSHYHATLRAGGVQDYSLEDLWADYRLAVLSQFGLVIVLSHVLGGDTQGTDDPEAVALAGIAGGRLIEAMRDLRPWELLESAPLWKRMALFARKSASFRLTRG
jgi:hypothetical protein